MSELWFACQLCQGRGLLTIQSLLSGLQNLVKSEQPCPIDGCDWLNVGIIALANHVASCHYSTLSHLDDRSPIYNSNWISQSRTNNKVVNFNCDGFLNQTAQVNSCVKNGSTSSSQNASPSKAGDSHVSEVESIRKESPSYSVQSADFRVKAESSSIPDEIASCEAQPALSLDPIKRETASILGSPEGQHAGGESGTVTDKQRHKNRALGRQPSSMEQRQQQEVECPDCGWMFDNRNFLNLHQVLMHTNRQTTCKTDKLKEYVCKHCQDAGDNKSFGSFQVYMSHLRQVHNDERHFCSYCNKTFKLKGSLLVHQRVIHHTSDTKTVERSREASIKREHTLVKEELDSPEPILPTLFHLEVLANVVKDSIHPSSPGASGKSETSNRFENGFSTDGVAKYDMVTKSKMTELSPSNAKASAASRSDTLNNASNMATQHHPDRVHESNGLLSCRSQQEEAVDPLNKLEKTTEEQQNRSEPAFEKGEILSDPVKFQAYLEEGKECTCSTCNKTFSDFNSFYLHVKVHQDSKQWECNFCLKKFTTKYFLKKHKRLHTGETPYSCEVCGKTFAFQQSYYKHMLYHTDEKPYSCSTCGRAFKELSTLQNHERIHSGERPFVCETCSKSFRQRVSYLVHRRIHTGVMPYVCDLCGKKFRYKVTQRTHKCPGKTEADPDGQSSPAAASSNNSQPVAASADTAVVQHQPGHINAAKPPSAAEGAHTDRILADPAPKVTQADSHEDCLGLQLPDYEQNPPSSFKDQHCSGGPYADVSVENGCLETEYNGSESQGEPSCMQLNNPAEGVNAIHDFGKDSHEDQASLQLNSFDQGFATDYRSAGSPESPQQMGQYSSTEIRQHLLKFRQAQGRKNFSSRLKNILARSRQQFPSAQFPHCQPISELQNLTLSDMAGSQASPSISLAANQLLPSLSYPGMVSRQQPLATSALPGMTTNGAMVNINLPDAAVQASLIPAALSETANNALLPPADLPPDALTGQPHLSLSKNPMPCLTSPAMSFNGQSTQMISHMLPSANTSSGMTSGGYMSRSASSSLNGQPSNGLNMPTPNCSLPQTSGPLSAARPLEICSLDNDPKSNHFDDLFTSNEEARELNEDAMKIAIDDFDISAL